MSWSTGYGFNFRYTAGFVTDGTDEFFAGGLGGTLKTYPTTFTTGVVGGWTANPASADDTNASYDQRIAGASEHTNATAVAVFQLDLPASGSYRLRLGARVVYDARIEIYDGASLLAGFNTAGTGASDWRDIAGSVFSTPALWASGNATQDVTFSGTTLTVKVGEPAGGAISYTRLGHLFVQQLGGGGGSTIIRPWITG